MPLSCPIVLHPPFVPPPQPLENQLTADSQSLLLIPLTRDSHTRYRPITPCLVPLLFPSPQPAVGIPVPCALLLQKEHEC